MPLTAGELIVLALEAAHSPGKGAQALSLLNAILSDVCQERDFAEARGQFLFNFTPTQRPGGGVAPSPTPPDSLWGSAVWGGSLWASTADWTGAFWGKGIWGAARWGEVFPPSSLIPVEEQAVAAPAIWPGVQFGSGPYQMPVDFLRLSGSSGSHGAQRSFIWWLDGVPYPVIPTDLAEFDMQVQQIGLNSYVWLAATDMSAPIDDRMLLSTTGDLTAGSTAVVNLADTARLIGGNVLGVAGQGIVPGTTLLSLGETNAGLLASDGSELLGSAWGDVLGTGGSSTCILSRPANATIIGASIFFGYAPVIFVYPPPNGTQQAMIRYQKQMPRVTDLSRYPWLHNDGYLLDKLIGRLCRLNDDSRADGLLAGPNIEGSAENRLSNFLSMKDDEQSHPKRVSLDRRVFGRQISNLGITKRVGW
jgi:hypothetical protein